MKPMYIVLPESAIYQQFRYFEGRKEAADWAELEARHAGGRYVLAEVVGVVGVVRPEPPVAWEHPEPEASPEEARLDAAGKFPPIPSELLADGVLEPMASPVELVEGVEPVEKPGGFTLTVHNHRHEGPPVFGSAAAAAAAARTLRA